MDSFLSNPGLDHIGSKIFLNLDFTTLLKLRFVSQSWKCFLDNPRFWLKFLCFHGKIVDDQTYEFDGAQVTAIGDLSQMSVMAVILGHYIAGTFLTAITDLFKITFYMKYHQ